jgi:hypothetical protein
MEEFFAPAGTGETHEEAILDLESSTSGLGACGSKERRFLHLALAEVGRNLRRAIRSNRSCHLLINSSWIYSARHAQLEPIPVILRKLKEGDACPVAGADGYAPDGRRSTPGR